MSGGEWFTRVVAAIACAVGIGIGYYLGRAHQPKDAVFLLAKIKLKPGVRNDFMAALAKLAEHSYLHEPSTFTVRHRAYGWQVHSSLSSRALYLVDFLNEHGLTPRCSRSTRPVSARKILM
jgi:hypothetical protein